MKLYVSIILINWNIDIKNIKCICIVVLVIINYVLIKNSKCMIVLCGKDSLKWFIFLFIVLWILGKIEGYWLWGWFNGVEFMCFKNG